MNSSIQDSNEITQTSWVERFSTWAQDPLGLVVIASVATISTFGIVLSGIWAINVALN